MPQNITLTELRALRMHAQGLSPQKARSDAGDLLREVIAIQAQDSRAATLSIRPRTTTLTAHDARIASDETRSLVLTWCMRGTMHLLSAADVGWLMPIFGPVFLEKTAARYEQLGLDEDTRARALDAIGGILSQRGAVARPALRDLLTRRGFPTEGQAFIHLMRAAALSGLVCFGPEVGSEQSFVLLADWIEAHPAPDDPIAELAYRYMRAYGPATARDFASWSGLPKKTVLAGFDAIAEELVELDCDGSPLWMLADESPPPDNALLVRLLPAFDTLLLGYDNREWMIAAQHAGKIHPGGGIIKPSLLVNGEVLGTWSATNHGLNIRVEPFVLLTDDIAARIEAEAEDIGRYLDGETTLHFT